MDFLILYIKVKEIMINYHVNGKREDFLNRKSICKGKSNNLIKYLSKFW